MEQNSKTNFNTQKYVSDIFGITYYENKRYISELINIPDYDKKVTYLLKSFPHQDLVKIILEKYKFAEFQDKMFLDLITNTIEKDFEQQELRNLMKDLADFISTSSYIQNFDGRFFMNRAHIRYNIRNHNIQTYSEEQSRWNNFQHHSSPTKSDHDINFDQDGFETD